MSSAGQGYGEGFFYSPEDQAAQEGIRRRQAYAQALMQGRQHQGQYGGLADAGNSIAGALLAKRADKDATKLAGDTQSRYASSLADLLRGGSGQSPQVSNAPQELDPEGNPMASTGAPQQPRLDPEGNPTSSQAPSQSQPQSIMERIAASKDPNILFGFGGDAIKQQMQNENMRGNKVWENGLPMSAARGQEIAAQGTQAQDNATFNNQLPMTAAQRATLAQSGAQLGETRRHNQIEESVAQNPFGTGAAGQAVAQGKGGAEFLATLPPGVAAQIKAVGSYRQPAPAGRTSPTGMKFMSLVNQAYPSYDASQYGAKTKARNDFTTGKNGNTVRSLNVAVQHLDQLGALSEAMGNGDLQMVNKIGNYFATQTGKPAPSNFNAAKQLVGDEIVKAIVGAGGGVSDREEAAHNISASSSPQQLAGVIKTYQGLLSGQLSGLKQQYEKSTGLGDFEDYLAPETKAKLQAHAQGGQPASATPKKTVKFSDLP